MTLNRLTPSQHYTEKDISPRFWPNGKMPEREDWKQLAKGGFLPHQQPFFPANQPNALRIHPPTFPPQQRGKPPVSKPLALQCQLLQPGTERFPPFIPALPVPMCRPLNSHQPAGSAFRCGVLLPQELHRCSHGLRLYHFFETRSFNITRSSTWSATIRFSFRFSSSRCFSRWAFKSELVRLSHDWSATPRVLNAFTVYYNRMANPNIGAYKDIDGAKQLGIKNLSTFGFPNIDFGGGPFVGITNVGDPQNDFQVYMGFGLIDTLSFSKGRHFMKAGIDLRRNHLNTRPTQGGGFTFNARATAIPNEIFSGNQTGYAFASYLLGTVDSASLSDPVGLGGRRIYNAFFFQDDFKVNNRLTLNLGLRWEYQPPFTEVADRLSSWSPDKLDPATGRLGAYEFAGKCSACTGRNYFGVKSYRDFGPRFGFAYRLREKWTLRGAYGIMFEGDLFNGFSGTPLGKATSVQAGGTYLLSADPVTPWAGIFNWDGGFPTNRYQPPSYDLSYGDKNRPGMIDKNYGRSPYTQQWNLNVQRELIRNLVLDVGYVGNKSTGIREGQLSLVNQLNSAYLQQFGRNLNNAVRTPADAAANGIAYPYPGFQGTVASALRQYPQVQGNQTVQNYGAPLGFSTYHSLQITLPPIRERFYGLHKLHMVEKPNQRPILAGGG